MKIWSYMVYTLVIQSMIYSNRKINHYMFIKAVGLKYINCGHLSQESIASYIYLKSYFYIHLYEEQLQCSSYS